MKNINIKEIDILFSPIGIFMFFSFKMKSNKNIYFPLIFALILSFLIENNQYIFGLDYCEIDDVIMNFKGATFGTMPFLICKFIEHKRGFI